MKGVSKKEIAAEKRKQQQFLTLAKRFRNERDPEVAGRLGDELARMVFGGRNESGVPSKKTRHD